MNSKKIITLMLALAAGGMFAQADDINGITMNFTAPIAGGNSADTNGYGAVGYTYRIGTTEVSVEQFQASTIVDSDANYWNDGTRNVGSDAPVVAISWYEAAMYCNWLTSSNVNNGAYTISGGLVTGVTAREGVAMDTLISTYGKVYVLPTENEWYKAAYYADNSYSLYANGTGTAPVHGVDANFNTVGGYLNGPAWTVGSGTAEQNGTMNMMGNVWEWLESADDGTLDNLGSEAMAFRGGDYFQGAGYLDKDTRGGGELPSGEYYNVGFRVVEIIPEPGTISLMSLSTVGLFLTRTIRRRKRVGQTILFIPRERACDVFYSEQALSAHSPYADEEEDYLQVLFEVIKDGCSRVWVMIRDSYKEADKAFWNRMVVSHERKVERRAAFRQALRKRAIDSFDAFLACIMK